MRKLTNVCFLSFCASIPQSSMHISCGFTVLYILTFSSLIIMLKLTLFCFRFSITSSQRCSFSNAHTYQSSTIFLYLYSSTYIFILFFSIVFLQINSTSIYIAQVFIEIKPVTTSDSYVFLTFFFTFDTSHFNFSYLLFQIIFYRETSIRQHNKKQLEEDTQNSF